MAAVRPPRFFRFLAGASLALAILPAGFAVQYSRTWKETRAGRSAVEQRLSLKGVTWFKRAFVAWVDRFRRTVPDGAKVLVEPTAIEHWSGDSRWFLFLNYYAYPVELYVRQPALASGTLVDYPRWLEHHQLGKNRLQEAREISERGIEWRLRYPVKKGFHPEEMELSRLIDGVWVPQELAPARALRGAGDDD